MSILTLPIYDLVRRCNFDQSYVKPIKFEKTLLGAIYPGVEFAIGDASLMLSELKEIDSSNTRRLQAFSRSINESIKNGDLDDSVSRFQREYNEFKASAKLQHQQMIDKMADLFDAGWDDYQLVGGSGASGSARMIYAKGGGDYFTRLLGSPSNAVNYGSNLVTELKDLWEVKTKILVVKDKEYKTGDCHAKASSWFLAQLGIACYIPFQFRGADPNNLWVAKGTIAYSPLVDQTDYALIVPESCFKGNKVLPGEYNLERFIFGVVHYAPHKLQNNGKDYRLAHGSYSVVQYFPWEAVQADLLPQTLRAAEELNKFASDPAALLRCLIQSDLDELEEPEDLAESKQEYIPMLAKILMADKHQQLMTHPYIVKKIYELARKRWLKLATAGAYAWRSKMVMPDEELADGECCIPGMGDGEEVIVFPYPCRWQWDIKVWKNRALPRWQKHVGVIVGSEATMLQLGRDMDGDMLYYTSARNLPNIAAWSKSLPPAPGMTKPAKQKVEGTLGQIGVRRMNNSVGLITWHIAKAQAAGYTEIIPMLAQQLQIEVDSLKNVARADMDMIAEITKPISGVKVQWLSARKSVEYYVNSPLPAQGNDTISRLAMEVNKVFKPAQLHCSNLSAFKHLFDSVSPVWEERAQQRIKEYNQAIRIAHSPAEEYERLNKKPPRFILEQVEANRSQVMKEYQFLLDNCNSQQRMTAVAALWQACHKSNAPDARGTSLPFVAGLEEICDRLSEPRIQKFNLFNHEMKENGRPVVLHGEETLFIQVIDSPNGKGKQIVTRCGKVLAHCEVTVPNGRYPIAMYTRFNNSGKPSVIEAVVVSEELLAF